MKYVSEVMQYITLVNTVFGLSTDELQLSFFFKPKSDLYCTFIL